MFQPLKSEPPVGIGGHYKYCFARALICAVENMRDDEHTYMQDFARVDFAALALSYYDGVLIECICEG